MILDTSDKSWEMFLSLAQKAKAANNVWYSPIQRRTYQIKDITDSKIIIRREKGNDSKLGKRGYLFFLEHFNDKGGICETGTITGSVAKKSLIVNFHPLLDWSPDHKFIYIKKGNIQGGFTYSDFGSPPDDHISELQIFARKVRRGQKKFREGLMKRYGAACCISGISTEEVLDACHIEAHSKQGVNSLDNGVLLTADLHNLFDMGLLFIEPGTYRIHVHPKVNDRQYRHYDGKQIQKTTDGKFPGSLFLSARWETKNW